MGDDAKSEDDARKTRQFWAVAWGFVLLNFTFAQALVFSQNNSPHAVKEMRNWTNNSARLALLVTFAGVVLNIISPFVSPPNRDIATERKVTYPLLSLLLVLLIMNVFTQNHGAVVGKLFPKFWAEIKQ